MVPDYHRQVFFEAIYNLPPQTYTPIVAKEIQEVAAQQAPVQNTFRAIVARESCLFQIKEMDKVIPENLEQGKVTRELTEEMVNILHSLRMLSLHVVKCIIDWRKQLVCNFLLGHAHPSEVQNNRFKTVPFVYEEQNYLLKMQEDTKFLVNSNFAKFFNFSPKADPFLVFPSQKHAAPAVGGAASLKRLRKPAQSTKQAMVIPLQNNLMKMIRQSEVYMMEEAVT